MLAQGPGEVEHCCKPQYVCLDDVAEECVMTRLTCPLHSDSMARVVISVNCMVLIGILTIATCQNG